MTLLKLMAALVLLVVWPDLLLAADQTEDTLASEAVSFQRDIRPIFQTHCHGCHQSAKSMGDYVITTADGRMNPGESGESPIVAGKPDESYLLDQITPIDGVAAMPKDGPPLAENQLVLVRRWIEEGAIDDAPAEAIQYDAEHLPEYTSPPVIASIDYAPDGKSLAVAGFHEVLIHRPDGSTDGAPLARLVGMSERIESVRYSPDGSLLAVTGGKPARMGEVQIWNVAQRELVVSLPVTFDTVYGASWSPDGKLLAFGCGDKTVRVIEAETGKQVLFQSAHSDWVLDTVFSVDGSHLASVGRDATAKLIEVPTQRFVDNITSITPGALRGGINAVARHPLRDEILFGGADGVPKIYRMHRTVKRVIGDDANLLWELPPLTGRVFSVDYSLDGAVIAAGSSLDGKGAIHVYGIDPEANIPEEITKILVKPTHQRSDEEKSTLQKNFADGIRALAKITVDTGGIYAVSIHPEATHVAAAGTDGIIRVINVSQGDVVHEFAAIATGQPTPINGAVAAALPYVPAPTSHGPAGNEPEVLPPDAKITRLTIEPGQVDLRASTDYAQVIVLAELSAGEVIDVTRMATLAAEGVAQVSPFGLVTATGDGPGTVTATLAGQTAQIPIAADGISSPLKPDYIQDVSPILARAGCNAGTCHGAQDGKNGFKLSLRGYDPLFDVRALTDDLGSRRTNLASAQDSLLLLKPSGKVPHQGGVVVPEGSDYYRTLLAWVTAGAALNLESPGVTRLDVQPMNPIVQAVGAGYQMRVVAYFSDGSHRDVTREAFVESGDTEIAKPVAGQPGLIKVLRRGEAPVLVRYEGAYAATTITVIGDRTGFTWQTPPVNNRIDKYVHAKLIRTKTTTAPLADDYSFVRRVYLDLIGLLPTPDEVTQFVEDPRDSRWKRDALIDELIGSPDYVEHWTNKWADLLQVNSKFLGREGAQSFRNWIRENVQANTAYDELTRRILTASGSNRENPAASYYKILREPESTMENTTQLFLATRFNCNKCHDHPFERWTQDQYYELSAFFARVGLKKDPESGDKMVGGTAVESAQPLYEIVFAKPDGEVKHLRTSQEVAPTLPFECAYECDDDAARRERLAAWISSKDNPYFAMSFANRIWAYLTGRGIIEPIDDIRAGNPPTNPELLNWLADQFVQSGFDTQHLIRTICRSRTYQLALATDPFNEDDEINYSHAKARRLPAEVLYDAIYRATGATSMFEGLPKGTRAAELPDVGIRLPDGFLNNLGRPPRESACECERSSELQMGPIMALINGATVGEAISQPDSAIEKIVNSESDNHMVVEQLFMRTLNRHASDDEIADALKLMDTIDVGHQAVEQELSEYEATLGPILEEREQQRLAALAEKKTQLTEHVAKMAPVRERLAKEREQAINSKKAELTAIREKSLVGLSDWEKERGSKTRWETLNPVSLSSNIGEEFAVQDDGSVFVSGKQGEKGFNLFLAPADVTGITGLRVEALRDDRLPKQGPGRAPDGNFVLNEIKLWAASTSSQPSTIIRSWDLSSDAEGWIGIQDTTITPADGKILVGIDRATRSKRLVVETSAPAEPLALDVTAKLDSPAQLTLLWRGEEAETFDIENRSVTESVTPGTATWRTYRLYFHPQSPVTGFQLKIHGGGVQTAFDSIRLVQTKPPEFKRIELQNAVADFSQQGYAVATAIDGKNSGDGNGWAVSPEFGKEHLAAFEIKGAYAESGEGIIKVRLVHDYSSGKHTLGRFRISITRSAAPHELGLPGYLSEIATLQRQLRSDEQQTTLEDFFLESQADFVKARDAVRTAEKPLPPDPREEQLKKRVAKLSQPLPPDAQLVRLQRAAELSGKQLVNKRLIGAQDIAWALINSPEFLYNH